MIDDNVADKVSWALYNKSEELHSAYGWRVAKDKWYDLLKNLNVDVMPPLSYGEDYSMSERKLLEGDIGHIVREEYIVIPDYIACDWSLLIIPNETVSKISVLGIP